MTVRNIITINEELCDGCGQCILDCAEHALAIVDGKAKVISDNLCDGLGACLQGCPQNALTIIEREAAPFDEEAVHALQKAKAAPLMSQTSSHLSTCNTAITRGCPSLSPNLKMNTTPWPLKLRILPENSPFLKNAHIILTADCAPATYTKFHEDFGHKVKISCCPKFEEHDVLIKKLKNILATGQPKSLHVLRMEVPCCFALAKICTEALEKDSSLRPKHHICSRDGQLLEANVEK